LESLGIRGGEGNNDELVENLGVNVRKGITDEDDNDVLGGALEEGSESALGLVSESFCLVKDNDLGRCLPRVKKEALHTAFHEGVDFLANDFQTSLVAAIQE
jgi:hypothetical protein